MDGKTLSVELRQMLSEISTSTWLDDKSTYDYLYEAAMVTADRTNCFTTSTAITTVASDKDYLLPPDFLKLYLTSDDGKFYVRYYDGTAYYWLYWSPYEEIILGNNTTSVVIPSRFTIRDAAQQTRITGTTTSAGSDADQECTLTDSTAPFASTTVYPGDTVYNSTDGSNGIVVAYTSTTALVTALYNGTDNDWTSSDAYTITPQGRFELVLDPPPSTAGHIITVCYVQRPAPVYSSKRAYWFAPGYKRPLLNYAAWLYKYRDSQPNYGDAYYKYWDLSVKRLATTLNQAMRRTRLKVNLMR
jgi:hypothetical protein